MAPVARWRYRRLAPRAASFAYLLPDGSILRPCEDPGGSFQGGGVGGRIQHFDAIGNLTWDYFYSTYDYQQHHDIQPMPNGRRVDAPTDSIPGRLRNRCSS